MVKIWLALARQHDRTIGFAISDGQVLAIDGRESWPNDRDPYGPSVSSESFDVTSS
jgi:CO dehydrogenase/acetyl-CoA synthase delta subunit